MGMSSSAEYTSEEEGDDFEVALHEQALQTLHVDEEATEATTAAAAAVATAGAAAAAIARAEAGSKFLEVSPYLRDAKVGIVSAYMSVSSPQLSRHAKPQVAGARVSTDAETEYAPSAVGEHTFFIELDFPQIEVPL